MKYYIVYTRQTEIGETHQKWIPSAHYELSAEYLLKRIETEPSYFDFLVVPFILTLSASLEANLNDWLVIDTFRKHGSERYKALAEGYTGVSFAKKLRLVVAVLTDNAFQLREDAPVVQLLDKLIATRNKITHPLAHFQLEQESETARESQGKVINHPLHTLAVKERQQYYQAVLEFDQSSSRSMTKDT